MREDITVVITGEETPVAVEIPVVPLVEAPGALAVKQPIKNLDMLDIPILIGEGGVSILVAVLVVLSYS